MKIAMGSDHAGYALKEDLKKFLERKGHEVKDFGTHSEESVDYPDYARPAAESVAKGEAERGIVICGSGVGVTIVANKVRGVRAVLANNIYTARQSREHGDCNVLTLAGKKIPRAKAHKLVTVWLKTKFSGGERHLRRIRKIEG
ncbi:MAG: ribose 5-phosphate isomerase B [Candidatus Saganbacteria bacterium]|nr:ribose 5-phosphate isomerase B [Candidatus Saganbacteria bacterium]